MNMKKLAQCLALSMLGLTTPALAANNPYVDVPQQDWSYTVIHELFTDGVLSSEDQKIYGSRTLTRYDMAVLTAKAMGKEGTATADQQASIEKLKTEYTPELQRMGILDPAPVPKVPGQALGTQLKIYGLTSIRNDSLRNSWDGANNINSLHVDLFTQYPLTPTTDFTVESTFNKGLANQWESDAQNSWAYAAWMTSKVGATTVKAGRFPYMPAYGLVYNDRINGAQLSAAKGKMTGTVTFGRNQSFAASQSSQVYDLSASSVHPENWYMYDGQRHYNALELGYNFDKDTTAKAAFQTWKDGSRYWEIGASRQVSRDWKVTAAMAKSNVDSGDSGGNTAYYGRVQYRNLNPFKPGDYTLYAAWLKVPMDSTICPMNQYDLDYTYNFKGWVWGAEFVVRPKETINLWLMTGTKVNSYSRTNILRLEYNFLMF